MTEVVIAMAVIVMVSGAAISVLIASIKADASFENKYFSLAAVENAAECLQFADDNVEELEKSLKRAGFEKLESIYVLEKGDEKVTVSIENENYVVKLDDEIIYTFKNIQE